MPARNQARYIRIWIWLNVLHLKSSQPACRTEVVYILIWLVELIEPAADMAMRSLLWQYIS